MRSSHRLANETFDLLIIGGGVNGLATAWDAALRGLKVGLVEKGDYGGATSSASLKIIHGGLRYLQHLDLVRMREHIVERRALQRIAPHLIEPFPFLVPTHGLGLAGRPAIFTAFAANDLISFDRNHGLSADRCIPRGRLLSRKEVLEIAPGLPAEGLTGGGLFHDARMHNAERMNLLFASGAHRLGAALANYTEVTGFRKTHGRLEAAQCRDLPSGDSFEIRAKAFLNMTGPWTDQLIALAAGVPPPPQQHSAGFQIITPPVTTREIGLAVASRHIDPDSKLKRGGRAYFTTTWRGQSIWGTTDHLYEGAPEDWRITEAQVATFLDEINQAMPGAELARSAVVHAYGGLRPIEAKNVRSGSQVSRHMQLFDHAKDLDLANFVSLRGVKYTACRLMAERSLELLLGKLDGTSSRPCATKTTPLPGAEALPVRPDWLDADIAHHLERTYGSEMAKILERMQADPESRRRIPGSWVTRAEFEVALGDESAIHLEDVVFRRTELGTLGHPGEAALEEAGALMAVRRVWSPERLRSELESVRARFLGSPQR